MNERGIIVSSAVLLACLSAIPYSYAQYSAEPPKKPFKLGTSLDDALTRDRGYKGNFGLSTGSKTNTYRVPSLIEAKTFDLQKTQKTLEDFSETLGRLQLKGMIKFQPVLPSGFNLNTSDISIDDFVPILDEHAVQNLLNQQLSKILPIARKWEEHGNALGEILNGEGLINNGNFNSIVNFEALGNQISNYINDNDLLAQAQNDIHFLQNIDWNISLSDFIDEAALQNALNANGLSDFPAQDFLIQGQTQIDQSFQENLTQSISLIREAGISLDGQTLTLRTSAIDKFTFLFGNSSADGACTIAPNGNLSAWFNLNLGGCLIIQGNAGLDTEQMLANLSQHGENAIQNIINTVIEGAQNSDPNSYTDLFSDLQNQANQLSQNAIPLLLQELRNNFSSELTVTIDFKKISDGFTGEGAYELPDHVLNILANDIGTLTFNKQQIIDIVTLMANGDELLVGQYVFEHVAGYDTDIIGFDLVRDNVNGFLSEFNQKNIFSVMNEGLTQVGPASFTGSANISRGEKANWVATGGYNIRTMINSPILKPNGSLFLKTEFISHSVGIAYLPLIWKNNSTHTSVRGVVHAQALFIKAKAASVMAKSRLSEDEPEEIIDLYRFPLNEIPEARKTYILPNLYVGLIGEQDLTPSITLKGYFITYPGLAQRGQLSEITRAIAPLWQMGASFSFRIIDAKKSNLPSVYIAR